MFGAGACHRRLLWLAGRFVRFAIIVVAFLGVALSGPPVSEGHHHDGERVVASTHAQSAGACHQSSHHCPVAIEAEAVVGAALPPTRGAWLRPSNRPLPMEFLGSLTTPPPRA